MPIIPNDVLCGAAHLCVNQMQAFRLLRAGRVPGLLVRMRWYARASDLDAARAVEARP